MQNKAFTLVELLAATVLSTLLFIAAIAVIRSLGRAQKNDEQASTAWTSAARQQIEWDFANAVVLRQDEHGLILGGYGSIDAIHGTQNHLPVLVTYSLRDINSRRWLVREQLSLDPLMIDLNSSELVCGDVKTFSVTGSSAAHAVSIDMATSAEEDPTPIIFQHIAGAQRLPDQVRIHIDLVDQPAPLMNNVLYLR